MNTIKTITLILVIGLTTLVAQSPSGEVQGSIHGLDPHGTHMDTIPLAGANIFWLGTNVGTTSDLEGRFIITRPSSPAHMLVVNYVGYENDTLHVDSGVQHIRAFLETPRTGKEVLVSADAPSTIHRKSTSVNTETITGEGLTELACCSLAESFENTASVEVQQSDAVSGAKRIKMLGLAGFYTQFLIEKKPVMRGLVNPFSLEYVPGFWMDAVDISKGTASVATGYESVTGQINIELKKPENSEPFAANAYMNSMGKSDVALLAAHPVNDRLSTMLLTYGTYMNTRWDGNNDTFLDMPLMEQINIMNRWKYNGEKFKGQLGLKHIQDRRRGGQVDFDHDDPSNTPGLYGAHTDIDRQELYAKAGMLLDDGGSSVGLVISAFQHEMDAQGGTKTYFGSEASFYADLSYNRDIKDHKLSIGASYELDERDEEYVGDVYTTSIRVPGIYGEFTYQPNPVLTALMGVRYDSNNLHGDLITPRAHLKYLPDTETSIRFSVGKGFRHPSIFTDNSSILNSARTLVIEEDLKMESAWNAGFQFSKDLFVNSDRPISFVMDYYRTEFLEQVVADRESDPFKISFYNLDGKSFSNALQAELSMDLVQDIELTTAVRYNDVKTTYAGELRSVPLNSPLKGLAVLTYNSSDEKWEATLTSQYTSKARLPNTSMNPAEYQLNEYGSDYVLLFAQVKRDWGDWEVYAGVENLTDFHQETPILAWEDPFGPYFDSSVNWGPIDGRRFYVGFRFH